MIKVEKKVAVPQWVLLLLAGIIVYQAYESETDKDKTKSQARKLKDETRAKNYFENEAIAWAGRANAYQQIIEDNELELPEDV